MFLNDYLFNSLSDLNLNRLFNGLNLIGYNNDEDEDEDDDSFSNIVNFSDGDLFGHPEDLIDKFMNKFITIKINDENKKSINPDKCLICLNVFKNGDEIVKKVQCNHCFLSKCIVEWLKIRNSCPICKLLLIKEKEDEEE